MLASCFRFIQPSAYQYLLYEGTHTLNVLSCYKYWPENGLMKPKHVAKSMYY
jgi:hypothetical protein